MKIRNRCLGPLVIADAKLRLAPGEVVEVERPTPQTQGALERGLIEEASEETPVGAPEAPPPTPDVSAEYQGLSTTDAIEQIDDETDPQKLEALLKSEKRKAVVEALHRRLQEVKAGGPQ